LDRLLSLWAISELKWIDSPGLSTCGFGTQGQTQVAFHDIDELFAFMLVGHRLVVVVRLDGDHEGAQVAVGRLRRQGDVAVGLGALVVSLGAAVANGGALFLA
jgi:hypothetical protein